MRNKVIYWSYLSFGLGMVLTFVVLCILKKYEQHNIGVPFEYEGRVATDDESQVKDTCDDKLVSIAVNPSFAYDLKEKKAIVRTPRAAAKIGMAVLVSRFGKDTIESQKPFEVLLLNGKVWKVMGNEHSVFKVRSAIYIQRIDGKILSCCKNTNSNEK